MSNLLKRKSFEKENSKAFFYTISEFSNLTKLSKHTIRNLENEYGLEISRDAKGNRIYNENDVEQFQKIYFAKDSYSRTTNSKSSQLQNYDKSTSIDGDVKQPLVFGFDSLKKGVNNTEYIQKDTKKIPRPATKVSLNYSNMYAFPVIAIMFFAFIFLNNIESYLKDLTNSRLFSTQDLSSRNTSVLQSTAEIFENRFDVNIPSNFSLPSTFEDTVEVVGTSNFIGNASFRSISVGEIQITPSGIFAPNLVNLLSLSPEEKNLLLDTTTPNNPVLSLKTNLDLSEMTTDNAVIDTLEVSSIQGLSQLDEESIQTIEDSITFPTDAETLNGLSSDNFLRSNTNTVFTGGTFDISSGSIFNATSGSSIVLNSGSTFQLSSGSTFKLSSVPPNSNLKVDSSGNLSYFTFSEGDVSPVTTSNSVSFNLNTVNTNPGTFGSASQIPVLTVDEKGRVTGVTTVVNPSAGSSSVVTNISFSTPQPAFRTFTLERTILENLSTTFSLGSIDITTALNYTPLNKEGDTMSGPLLVLGNINSTQNISSLNLTSSFGSFTTLSTGTLTLTNPLSVIYGGTGQTSSPLNGQLLIGNGTGYTLSTLTAGSNVQISNASGYISISATDTDTDTNFYPTTMTVTGTNTKTITLSGVGMGSVIATFSDIGGGDTNPNNFVTGISFSGSNAQRTLTLNRDGLSSLTTSFSLSSSDITTALNYTPLNKSGDTMSGSLLVQSSINATQNITSSTTISAPTLTSTDLNSTNLSSTNGTISTLNSTNANLTNLTSSTATLTTLNSSTLNASSISASTLTLTNPLSIIYGGTGVTQTPTSGQLLIGNGSGYTLSTLTAGSNVSISNASGSIFISSIDTDTNYYPNLLSISGTTTKTITLSGPGMGILTASFTDIDTDTTNPNNFVTGISFSGSNAQRTLTLDRNGLSSLSTSFSLLSSDITTALNYTPLNKSGDTMSGSLLVQSSINATQNITSSTTISAPTLTSTNLSSTNGTISTLNSTNGTISTLNSTNGTISTLNSTNANLTNLTSSTATLTTLNSSIIKTSSISASTLTLTNPLSIIYGGTGVTQTPTSGQLLIGNGSGYTLSTLTAGNNVSISNASGSIFISSIDTDTNYYPNLLSISGTTTKTITLSGPGMGILTASFTDIDTDTTNPNNFVTGISFSGSNAQRTLTLNRDGLSSLTTSFSLSSSDITTALNYTPLNKAGDTMSGPLLIQGNLSVTNEGTVSAKVLRQNGNEVCDTSLNCDGLGTGLSGSGSLGFIPTFVSSRGLANSIIYQINSKIGINKTNPSATLDIEGSVQASTTIASATILQNGYQVCDASGNCPNEGVGLSGSGVAGYLSYFNSSTGLSSSAIFQSGSNIGLGTTSPTNKLEVLGTTKTTSLIVTNTSSIGTLTLTNPLAIIYGGTALTQTPTVGQILFGNSSNSYSLGTISQGTGIQVTTSPAGYTISSTVVDTTNPNNFVTGIAFSGSNSQRTLTIDRQGLSSLTTSFSLASSDITTALNYTPLSKAGDTMSGPLLVQSSINATGNISSSTTISAPSLIQNGSLVCDTSGNCSGLNGTVLGSGTTNYLPVFTSTNSLANSVIYQIGGNVGIGTTSLSNTLQVSGTIGAVSFSGSGVNLISLPAANLFGTVSGNLGVTSGSASSSFVTYNGTSSTSGQFDGGTTTPIRDTRLNYNGYLYATRFYGNGANLTSLTAGNLSGTIPSSVLAGSSLFVGTTEIALNRSSSALSLTGITGITSTTVLNLSAGGSNQNIILSPSGTGRVGVNNTNPQYTLDVTGSLNASQVYINGSLLSAGASAWDVLGSNIYRMTGNVGIGTSTPSTTLEVSGGILASGSSSFIQSNRRFIGPQLTKNRGTGLGFNQTFIAHQNVQDIYIPSRGVYAYSVSCSQSNIQQYSVNQTTGKLTTLSPSTLSTGVCPRQITGDLSGRYVYVINQNSGNISQYSINQSSGQLSPLPTPTISVFTGSSSPTSIIVDPRDRFLYVTNAVTSGGSITQYSINKNSGQLETLPTSTISGGLSSPNDLVIDPTGRYLYVANRFQNNIVQYSIDQVTGQLNTLPNPTISAGSQPLKLAVDPSGRFVYAVNNGSTTVSQYTINQSTGQLTAMSTPSVSLGSVTSPRSIQVDQTGNFVYVTATTTAGVIHVLRINQFSGELSLEGTFGLSDTEDTFIHPSGNFYYSASPNQDAIHEYMLNNLDSGSAFFSGFVGVGTTNPGSRLHVLSAVANDALLVQDDSGTCEAQPTTTGLTWSCSSDQRFKTNISQASNVLPYILGIPLNDYTVIQTGERVMGPVAQNMLVNYPELVTMGDDGYYNVSSLSSWMQVKAIQEQQTQISTLSQDSLTLSSVSTNLSSAMQSLVTSSSNLESVNGNLSLAMNNLISTQASFELRLNNFSNALGNITMTQSEFSLSLNTLNLKQEELSTALGSLNLTTFQSMYDSLQNTLDALTMDTLNGELVISSDLLVNGDSIFNNATFTGDVSIGQMSFNTLDNSLNVLGASCVNLDNTLNNTLCTSQTLYVMKNTSGYIDFFDGQITFKPNGDLEVKRVVAQEVQASEYKVASTSEISGTGIINSGDLEILILSDKVKSNSKIFVTATTDLKGKSLYVAEKTSEISFKVKLNEISDADIHFDWFILNME